MYAQRNGYPAPIGSGLAFRDVTCKQSVNVMPLLKSLWIMEYKSTSYQVARSAMPDAEAFNKMYLIKNVLRLRATYQIRLLAFRAVEEKKRLIIRVPSPCKFDKSLTDLIKVCNGRLLRENY